MKIDRHSRTRLFVARVKVVKLRLGAFRPIRRFIAGLLIWLPVVGDATATSSEPAPATAGITSATAEIKPAPAESSRAATGVRSTPANSGGATSSNPKAVMLLDQTIDRLANGPAFNTKVRQRVWAVGQEVRGIGTYEQAGYGSGRFNLQISMFDGSGKHSLQQISDGRLAWTRTVIDDEVSLRRVDVGRLDEWIPVQARNIREPPILAAGPVDFSPASSIGTGPYGVNGSASPAGRRHQVAPRLMVGAWTEMLDTLRRNHWVRLGSSRIESRPVLVVIGTLRDHVRRDVMAAADGVWPEMYPTTVKVAIATEPDPETGFGEGMPLRFEFWSDPRKRSGGGPAKPGPDADVAPRLITLIELFAMYPMNAPPVERFRFENQDADVNFVNETDQYLRRYGVRITDSQRRLLWR